MSTPPAVEYCYSLDEESYTGRYASVEDALSAANDDLASEREEGETATVWVGEVISAAATLRRMSLGRQIDWFIEGLDEALADEIPSDDTIIRLAPEHRNALEKLIKDFLCEHATFDRYSVERSVEHIIVVGDGEARTAIAAAGQQP